MMNQAEVEKYLKQNGFTILGADDE